MLTHLSLKALGKAVELDGNDGAATAENTYHMPLPFINRIVASVTNELARLLRRFCFDVILGTDVGSDGKFVTLLSLMPMIQDDIRKSPAGMKTVDWSKRFGELSSTLNLKSLQQLVMETSTVSDPFFTKAQINLNSLTIKLDDQSQLPLAFAILLPKIVTMARLAVVLEEQFSDFEAMKTKKQVSHVYDRYELFVRAAHAAPLPVKADAVGPIICSPEYDGIIEPVLGQVVRWKRSLGCHITTQLASTRAAAMEAVNALDFKQAVFSNVEDNPPAAHN